ncbi:MAG: CBS domain-containing protein [Acetobacteraceae bacterium]|nr:CBS domain-containing protein [Acetobacteraceae bacterium]
MTREVISVTHTTELADIAMLLETKRIKRVPVLSDGKLVGIVSRANLVRALAATNIDPAIDADDDDRAIRDKLLAELMAQERFQVKEWFKIWAADIMVRDRIVHIWFSVDHSKVERWAARIVAQNIAGVRGVEEHVVPAL